ncbi:hypothetical protein Csa_012802 [Cucumis sativus]|nr:hypothetical protein Csa_012802 [Cucumis sativus]
MDTPSLPNSSSDLFDTIRSDLQSENDSINKKIDRDGDGFPRWNEKLVVDRPMHAAFVVVEVCRSASSGWKVKIVGKSRVSMADFVVGYLPESHLQFLSYRLRDERGEMNGIINFSVRVKLALGVKRIGVPVGMAMPKRRFHGGDGGSEVL